jgi:hypothetical protein
MEWAEWEPFRLRRGDEFTGLVSGDAATERYRGSVHGTVHGVSMPVSAGCPRRCPRGVHGQLMDTPYGTHAPPSPDSGIGRAHAGARSRYSA